MWQEADRVGRIWYTREDNGLFSKRKEQRNSEEKEKE
jgi:hypothetical protein